jgi:hypothetical protein
MICASPELSAKEQIGYNSGRPRQGEEKELET